MKMDRQTDADDHNTHRPEGSRGKNDIAQTINFYKGVTFYPAATFAYLFIIDSHFIIWF